MNDQALLTEKNDTEDDARLGVVHSDGFVELLESMNASLLVSTYQAGKLSESWCDTKNGEFQLCFGFQE